VVGGKYVEVLHEVEIKSTYIDKFKWDTVHIPALMLDTTAPTVVSTNLSNGVAEVTFSEMMDNATLTVNNSDTSCSGTFQISANDFQNCLKFTHDNFVISNSEKTFRMTGFSLSGSSKLRITSGATDVAGNSLSTLTISF
jgi:hypothetical protein